MFKLLMFCLSPVLIAQPLALRAGAAQVDINPRNLPVVINCGFLERSASEVKGNLFARSVVFDDGKTRIAMTVVDSCMMPRELIDRAKQMASVKTGIPMDRMMISATHTHSAPAAMACLGSREQRDYAEWLPGRVAEAIAEAATKLEPARIGAVSIDAPEHTFCRRWIYKPEKMLKDPFGEVSVRANMIPGYQNPDVISPSGPVDSELSIVSIQAAGSGKPIAVIANYGNHYFGASGVSPDYFGLFDKGLAEKIGGGVVMMSQGTSGDANTANYAKAKPSWTIEEYAGGLIDLALLAYKKIQYEAGVPVLMAESTLPLGRRLASAKRLEWATETARNQKGEKPANQPEVYAHEQLYIRDTPRRELKLQAIRIGNIGFTAIPNEVYALTGLKLKAQSPMPRTINIELANGAEGYIPPPEQHLFGGYGQHLGNVPGKGWRTLSWTWLPVYPLAVGFSYLLNNEVLLSLWLFHLIYKMELVVADLLGYQPQQVGMGGYGTHAFASQQAAGAALALLAWMLYTGRHQYLAVVRRAFGGE